jgi:UPF0271 protein
MPTERLINLNADLGEGYGNWTLGDDEAVLDIVASANIACGFHAGDPDLMRRTVRACVARGVDVGAHPAYDDLPGFGRRFMERSLDEIENLVAYQIGALAGIVALEGARIAHVKPHGALNNRACADRAIADAVVRAVSNVDTRLILVAPATSLLAEAGRAVGLRVVEEVFADRTYRDDGQLVSRTAAGATIQDAAACVAHALAMLDAHALIAQSGNRIPAKIASICVHGDSGHAVAIARQLRDALERSGWRIAALAELIDGKTD